MQKNTRTETKKILSDMLTPSKKLRIKLLELGIGESITMKKTAWQFKSSPAEYLYTMRRIDREYSYATYDDCYVIIRTQ